MATRALLVGINDYPGSENDLRGCVNDATNVYDLLVKYFGYQSRDVVLLTDARGTTDAILGGLRDMVARSAPGDRFVFLYSGHGSQVPDADGDEAADRLDEILCPHDFDWQNAMIRDDELAEILGRLPDGVVAEILLDSCHSGTGTREMVVDRTSLPVSAAVLSDQRTFWASRHCIRPKYLAPPPDVVLRADDIWGPPLPVRRLGERSAGGHVLWAACRANQYSADADLGGRPGGAFTYSFCKHVRDANGKITRADLLKRVRASLRHDGFSQVPQLECPADDLERPVFG